MVPRLPRYYGPLRFPPPIPPHFVFLRSAVRSCALSSLPRGEGTSLGGLEPLRSRRLRRRGCSLRDDGLSQVPGVPLCAYAVLFDPGRFPRLAMVSWECCRRLIPERRLHRCESFEALSHGLRTRCLRFVTPVARTPRKTRFWLVASLCQAGFRPAGYLRLVSDLHRSSSSPRLILAHGIYSRGAAVSERPPPGIEIPGYHRPALRAQEFAREAR